MTYHRWIIAGTLALALGACRTASDKRTASAGSDREKAATAQATTTDADRRKTDRQDPQDVAAEEAPSTRPQEGVGGHDPHPMPSKDQQGQETYTGNAPQEPSLEGRVPESRQGDAQASATGNAGAAATTGTGSAGTSDTGTGASASAGTGDVGASGSVGTDGAGASAGGTGSTGSGAAPGTTASPSEVSGRVALVDKDAHEIAIDSGTATTQVKVAKDAQILINGSKGSFSDIKQGAQIRASLDQSSGDVQATRLEVTSKAAKK